MGLRTLFVNVLNDLTRSTAATLKTWQLKACPSFSFILISGYRQDLRSLFSLPGNSRSKTQQAGYQSGQDKNDWRDIDLVGKILSYPVTLAL